MSKEEMIARATEIFRHYPERFYGRNPKGAPLYGVERQKHYAMVYLFCNGILDTRGE